ncbi:MAG: PEP-CTERM sorting domain-containing protein [Phycisphaeraceae bacterium]|nr:MAG: PEP-CTERM sorting domain-containing protein [Phycisphaeraceae bacterium]
MKIAAVLAVAALAGSAMADFNTGIQAGPFNSDGPAGFAGNGFFDFNYTGSNFFVGGIRIRGDATSGGVGSFLSELRFRVLLGGSAVHTSGQLIAGTSWVGTQAVDHTGAAGIGLVNGNTYRVEFWESFNDTGVDATWTNVQFDFIAGTPPTPPQATKLGFYGPGAFDINTFGSGFDTELGLYNEFGALIATNDDTGGLQSQILANLGNGKYYIAVGGFNSTFAGAFGAVGGAANGDYVLNINGDPVAADNLGAQQIDWYCFTVPTPGSIALLGMGGLLAARRRR